MKAISWQALSGAERRALVALATRIVRREEPKMRELYGSHFLGMGMGFRTKGKGRVRKEFTIRVSVAQKGAPDSGDRGAEIPDHFWGYVVRRGRRMRLRIPTDVTEIRRLKHQRTAVRVSRANGNELGSLCCLLRDTDTKELFALSCKHVFGMTSVSPQCSGFLDARIDVVDPDSALAASVQRDTDLAATYPDSSLFSLDAAVARVDDPDAFSSRVNGIVAEGVLREQDIGVVLPGTRVRLPARSALIAAEIVEVTPAPFELPYHCAGGSHRLRFRRLMKYRCSPRCEGGDSGAPVLLDDILVGMHFGELTGKQGNLGVAMFAPDIIKKGTFGRTFELESAHNV